MPPIGGLTCNYAVVCLGSLARNEATPYSDLEFAILVENEDSEVKEYFRNLSKLFFILILNLKETTPRIMNIESLNWIGDNESPTPKGFSFDAQFKSGCKTPLGNVHLKLNPQQTYELICTPKKMAQFHNEENYKLDRHLSTVLNAVMLIDGNEKLLNEYQRETLDILDKPLNELILRQKRSLNWLEESLINLNLIWALEIKKDTITA